MFNKILLAADGSAHSLRAAEKAIYLAETNPEAKIAVVYVVDGSTSKSDVLATWDSKDVTEKRKEKIKNIEEKAKEKDLNYEILMLRGEPGPTIVKYANDNHYDLIVIGSRGLNSLQEMIIGSVSHKVVKRANCPVLIVK